MLQPQRRSVRLHRYHKYLIQNVLPSAIGCGVLPAWCPPCLVSSLLGVLPAWCPPCLVSSLLGVLPAWCPPCLVSSLLGVLPACVFRLSRLHTLEGTSLSNRRPPSSSSLTRSLHTSLLFFLMILFNAPQNIQNTCPLHSYVRTYFSFPGNKADVWSSLYECVPFSV